MRLVTFRSKDGPDRLGALIDNDEAVVDLYAARTETAFNSMLSLMEAGHEALQCARKLVGDPPSAAVLETSKISLQTPLPRPPQVRDFLCFEDHLN